MSDMNETFGETIHSYTRAQALEDGYLVDVTELGKEAGFKFPVAVTRAAWDDCCEWLDEDEARKAVGQDTKGRLWDVLYMAVRSGKRAEGDRVRFQVMRIPREGSSLAPELIELVAVCGPGDTSEPCITIGFDSDF